MQKKLIFDQTTALEVVPGVRQDATTVAADATDGDASILRDLAPSAPSIGTGSRQLVANYRSILAARAIYYPVAYRFPRELGRGRQGIVFLGLGHLLFPDKNLAAQPEGGVAQRGKGWGDKHSDLHRARIAQACCSS